MDSQVVFLLFIIAFAILSGIGKKRQQAERQSQQPPTDEGKDRPPTRDREGRRATARDRAEAAPQAKRSEQSSEELVPKDIWEEILGLARGGSPPPKPAGERRPSRTPPPPEPWEEEEPGEAVDAAQAPEAAPPPAAPVIRETVRPTPDPPQRIRAELFRVKTPRELRKAVVLREILGPPAALKD